MSEKIIELKKLWEKYDKSWNGTFEYDEFIKKYPKDKLEKLTLEDYTNIKIDDTTEYFTNWLERKTENCGKFRAASSYAYGIYKINPNNIKDESKKLEAQDKYKAFDESGKKSKKYLDNTTAETYFNATIRPLIIELANFKDLKNIRPLDINYARKVAYMYNVDKLIPIYKKEVLESIADFFGIKDEINFTSYKATEVILNEIKEKFDIQNNIDIKYSQKIASFLWEKFGKSVSFDSRNIIYYGAPGTGKTYTIQNAVNQKVLLEDAKVLFTQFHPSFGYEDFIEGLKPHNANGGTELKLTDGIFKKFCKEALDELKKARMDNIEPKAYYFVADEINRAELSTVFGELLLCIEDSKRVDFDTNGKIKDGSMLIATQYSYLYQNETDAVLIDDNKEYRFGVPTNLYFLGTMNDIDRSIDSFDLALRRRFVWIRMDCDYSIILNNEKFTNTEEENLKVYITICEKLNDYISNILELGKSYEIGHSYFMDIEVPLKGKNKNKITSDNVQNLFDKKLKPLIEEYLRGEYSQLESEVKIKIANEKFSL